MKYNIKTLLYSFGSLAILSACSAGSPGMSINLGVGSSIGKHVGLGTSISIPVSLDKSKTVEQSAEALGDQIITYFDEHGTPSTQATANGFYRLLVEKKSNKAYLVQDFYADNHQKRTDPILLSKQHLTDFQAHPTDGVQVIYAHNGNVMQRKTYQKNKLIDAQY